MPKGVSGTDVRLARKGIGNPDAEVYFTDASGQEVFAGTVRHEPASYSYQSSKGGPRQTGFANEDSAARYLVKDH